MFGRKTERLSSHGEMKLELDTVGSARWSKTNKRDGVILTILRLAGDRRARRQIRHEVIPQ
jgi:hypothetical protein